MNFRILQTSDLDEFQLVRQFLKQGADTSPVSGAEPDFVLVMKGFGGEFAEETVREIKRELPITPILTILGSWCEGEARTGVPLNGVHNVMWYDFLSMAPLEFQAAALGFPTVWALPEGAWPDAMETLAQRRDRVLLPERERRPCRMWIETDDFEQFRLLRDVFRTCFETEVFGRFAGCQPADLGASDFLVCDFPDFTPATQARFLELRTRFPAACSLAFLEFPRAHEWRWIHEHGGMKVFPKPFRIQDLQYFLK